MPESLFNKAAGLRPTFIKIETLAQVLSCEFAKFSRALFLQNTSGHCFYTRNFFIAKSLRLLEEI